MNKILNIVIICLCVFIIGLSVVKADGCQQFKTEKKCLNGVVGSQVRYACVWNSDYKDLNNTGSGFCSPTGLVYLSCGEGNTNAYDIPVFIPIIVSYAILILKTATPVILIFMGMFQLIKAIASQNEDEMKKARSSLIKKLIAAVIIFFMVSIVQFVVKIVADESEQASTSACLSCFINNDCANSYYYTDGYGNCYSIENNEPLEEGCPTKFY